MKQWRCESVEQAAALLTIGLVSVPVAYGAPAAALVVAKAGGEFSTVGAALASSRCPTTGCLIEVMPGVYTEAVILRPGVVLRGAGAANTILRGSGSGSVVVGAANSRITGFTVRGGTNGIFLNCSSCVDGPDMVIEDNDITGNTNGIQLTQYVHARVVGNRIFGNKVGIALSQYTVPVIRDNKIQQNTQYGISSSQYNTPWVTGNEITGNPTGVFLWYSNAIIQSNRVLGNANWDIDPARSTPQVTFNVYDKINLGSAGTPTGKFNVTSAGASIAPQ